MYTFSSITDWRLGGDRKTTGAWLFRCGNLLKWRTNSWKSVFFCDKTKWHGDPTADQIVRGPSGGCRGDLISTSDFGYSRVFYKSFLWGNLRFGGCFEKPSLQALFWCKKLRSRKKLAKLRKEEDRWSQPAPTVGPTAPTVGPMQVSVHQEIFHFSWHVAKSVLSSRVRLWNVKNDKKERRKRKTVANCKGKDKRFL